MWVLITSTNKIFYHSIIDLGEIIIKIEKLGRKEKRVNESMRLLSKF